MDEIGVLGVVIYPKLTFEKKVTALASSCRRKLDIVIKACRLSYDPDVTWACINGYVLPCLEYCSPVWDSAAITHLEFLNVAGRL